MHRVPSHKKLSLLYITWLPKPIPSKKYTRLGPCLKKRTGALVYPSGDVYYYRYPCGDIVKAMIR